MAKIIVSGRIAVSNGPQIPFNETLDVDAYDKIDLKVESTAKDKKIELQPGGKGQVQFLAIASDWVGPELSYKINSANSKDSFPLDRTLLCMGAGGVALLDTAPATLFFSNSTSGDAAKDANIQILIGRSAT